MRMFRTGSTAVAPVLFVHVMKTGGTTVVRNLRETFRLDQIYPCAALDLEHHPDGELDTEHHLSVPYLTALSAERRRTIRVYIGHFPYVVRELLGSDLQTATVLRDPVDRTISLLRQLKRAQPWEMESGERPFAERPLEELYEHPLVYRPLLLDHQTKIFSMTREDKPRSYTDVIDVDGARLAVAKDNLADLDVVGTMEDFQELLAETEARFGWKVVRGARKNVTPDSDLTPVDPSFRSRIAADNAIDVELFEYAKELVELRRSRRAIT